MPPSYFLPKNWGTYHMPAITLGTRIKDLAPGLWGSAVQGVELKTLEQSVAVGCAPEKELQ